MFFGVLQMECDKVFKRKLPWVGMIAVLLAFLLYFVTTFDVMRQPTAFQTFPWPIGLISGSFIVASTLPITSIGLFLTLVVVAGSTAQEYGWHSLQLWLCQGVSRPALFFAKVIVCCLTILAITLVALLVGIIVSIVAALQLHLAIDFSRLDLLQLFIAWLRLSYSILPYTMFAFMLAIVSRSIVPAISIGLGVAGIVEMLMFPLSLISPQAKLIWSLMPQSLAITLNQLNFAAAHYSSPPQGFHGAFPLTDPGLATLAIAIYTVVFLAIAYVAFLRQNMNG